MLCAMKLATDFSASQEERESLRGAANAFAYAPLRILIADDCDTNLLLVKAILQRWDIVPTTACNGEQAALLATTQGFDLVLMDIVMPVLDGIAATARIRRFELDNPARPPLPIVAYTSLDLGSTKLSLGRLGLTALLPKPCSATSLRLCLERWCPDRFFAG